MEKCEARLGQILAKHARDISGALQILGPVRLILLRLCQCSSIEEGNSLVETMIHANGVAYGLQRTISLELGLQYAKSPHLALETLAYNCGQMLKVLLLRQPSNHPSDRKYQKDCLLEVCLGLSDAISSLLLLTVS